MSFCAPFQEFCPLIPVGPGLLVAPKLYYRWSARAYSTRLLLRGNQSSVGSQCMVGSFGLLGMMGKQLVGHCMTGTCVHVHVEGSSKACHPLGRQVLDKGYSACPCALPAHLKVLSVTGTSTEHFRWNLVVKSLVCYPLGCVEWTDAKSR